MSENTNNEKVITQEEQIKTLLEQQKVLQIALNKARAVNKQKFRIETTQTSNNFHISFNQLFTTEQIKTDYKNLIIEETEKEIVLKVALKNVLKDRIIKALNKEV